MSLYVTICQVLLSSPSARRTASPLAQAQTASYKAGRAMSINTRQTQLFACACVDESISMAFLVLLERLTPVERAVFLLREVFDYPYGEIAEIVGKEDAACRQVFSRAKKALAAEQRPRFTASGEQHRLIVQRFMQAVGAGNMEALIRLLADDATLWADGGGKARGAATRPLHGAGAVARFAVGSLRFL